MFPEAEWGAILPCDLGWPLECAVATVASACTGLMWARPEVPWIEVSPERSISDATGASREVPEIADDCSRHNWCSSLARRNCKVESAALSTLVLTERGCVHSCGLLSNFGVFKTRFENYLPCNTFYTSAPHSYRGLCRTLALRKPLQPVEELISVPFFPWVFPRVFYAARLLEISWRCLGKA